MLVKGKFYRLFLKKKIFFSFLITILYFFFDGHSYANFQEKLIDKYQATNTLYFEFTQKIGDKIDKSYVDMIKSLSISPDAIERQLAHSEKDTVRAAYNRASFLEERKRMMQWYADYLEQLKENHG